MQKESYKLCNRCVMDVTASGIEFNENGICSYCEEFIRRSGHILNEEELEKEARLNSLIDEIKEKHKNQPYDCVVGVSGGVDSSWTLVKVVELGLRPLAVHMDNGWNSELAQNNISNLIETLKIDLFTLVIDWREYRSLMQAFFDADVIDVELLYDNAMQAVNYQMAAKHGLHHILSGTNETTEGMHIPGDWNWYKKDKKNIREIGRRFGNVKLKTFPSIGTADYFWYDRIRKIKWYSFLDYIHYHKEEALQVLETSYGYKRYPYKHYESVFTRFYQGYILPKKFGIDKRRVHLSTLIMSGQITREEALKDLEQIPYPSEEDLRSDIDYFLKKMKWTRRELDEYLGRPPKSHTDYPSEIDTLRRLSRIQSFFGERTA